jgi:hypothetical protein
MQNPPTQLEPTGQSAASLHDPAEPASAVPVEPPSEAPPALQIPFAPQIEPGGQSPLSLHDVGPVPASVPASEGPGVPPSEVPGVHLALMQKSPL